MVFSYRFLNLWKEETLEAFMETEFIQQLMQVEPIEDYSSFKTVKILELK